MDGGGVFGRDHSRGRDGGAWVGMGRDGSTSQIVTGSGGAG